MTVAKYFDEMSYGPAPESDIEARDWLARHASGFGHFINGAFVASASGKNFDTFELSHRQGPGEARERRRGGCRQCGCCGPQGTGVMGAPAGPRAGAPSLCACPDDPAPCASDCCGRGYRQRQADPRDPRSRRAAGSSSFLSSRRMGANPGHGICRSCAGGRRRPDHPVEFPIPDAGLESGAWLWHSATPSS